MKIKLILVFCVLLGLSWFTAISEAVNNPKKVQEHLTRAAELEAQGVYVDAVTEYEQALTYVPGDTAISLKMAEAASDRKQQEVRQHLQRRGGTESEGRGCHGPSDELLCGEK